MEATGCRLRPLVRLRPLISPSSGTLRAYRLLSSSSDYSSCRIRPSCGDPEERGTGSVVYQHTLKTQRPSTIPWQKELENHASFIGRVISPIKLSTNRRGTRGAYTQLKVESPSGSNKFLTIFLDMWEDIAEISIQHLKPNDYIYVSGYLRSYTKARDNGSIVLKHTVNVKEINYVTDNNKNTKIIEGIFLEESSLEKRRKRLHLWQVFFSNPHEWRDLRKSKINPRQPDFTHRGTGEALWISMYDPPWVMKQLQLQDSRMGDVGLGEPLKYRSNLSPLSYDDT